MLTSCQQRHKIRTKILAASDLQTTPETLTITYTYNPIGRLTAADYDNDSYFHYEYDAVGNRLSEQTNSGTIAYAYDDANRLTSVNGVTYDWDLNGNLLSDGSNTYSYDHSNRLVGVSGVQSSATFAYNGLGDRLQRTAGRLTTRYTLDLNNSLTQVLADGTNRYLYGLGRIAQQTPNGLQYFLPDALGSARQLTDAAGTLALTQSFDPYGGLLASQSTATTPYDFAGEWGDASGLIYLQARYYNPLLGRFTSLDALAGDFTAPGSLNRYVYALNHPLKYVDPTGNSISPPTCPFGCTIWDYSRVGGSSFGGRLLRAFISTGTELVDFILTRGATQTDPRACTWSLAGAEDRFITGVTPPNLLGVIGGRQFPLTRV